MRRASVLFGVVLLASVPPLAISLPVVPDGYSVETYATGIGAVAGVTVGPDGAVYAADNAGGRILRAANDGTVTVVASGIPYINGITFTANGRLFTASGGGQAIYEVAGGTGSVFAGGLSFPTSVAAWGNDLYASNSGNGTVSRIQPDGTISTVLTGLSSPNGAFGISFDSFGGMYFVDHASGRIYSYSLTGDLQVVGSVSAFGGTFTGFGFDGDLFATDVSTGNLMLIDMLGGASIFASGFSATAYRPAIGPNGIAYDGSSMFVGDGDTIYRITRGVPEPGTLALLGLGLAGLGFARRKKLN